MILLQIILKKNKLTERKQWSKEPQLVFDFQCTFSCIINRFVYLFITPNSVFNNILHTQIYIFIEKKRWI